MKICFASLMLCLSLAAAPAMAGDLYDNGPINGQVAQWTINFGFVVSDSFTLTANSTITGLSFGAWLFPGDANPTVEVSITSGEFGGTSYFDQVVQFADSNCFMNQYGYNVCTESAAFNGPSVGAGTYWINLQNAMVNSGDPVYWDMNSGIGCDSGGCPSQASASTIGTIFSESFTILGNATTTGTTPEPSSILLFGSGIVGLAGVLRRKLF